MARPVLIPKRARTRMLRNGSRPDADHRPLVKLFDPASVATWLLNRIDPHAPDRVFGLSNANGTPELRWHSLHSLHAYRGRLRIGLERDRHCALEHPISVYAAAARRAQRVVLTGPHLEAALRTAHTSA